MFAGFCKLPALQNIPVQVSPAFFKHARKLEISVCANFTVSIPCSDFDHPVTSPLHNAFDFHWLHLDRFDNLADLKIWVNSRAAAFWADSDYRPYIEPSYSPRLLSLSSKALGDSLQTLKDVKSVAVSAALHQDVRTSDGAQHGFVDGIGPKNVRMWKRGTGDRHHPNLSYVDW